MRTAGRQAWGLGLRWRERLWSRKAAHCRRRTAMAAAPCSRCASQAGRRRRVMATEATILVVEDDVSLRRSLEMTLKAAGYVAVGAGTLSEARRMRAHYKPQAIL